MLEVVTSNKEKSAIDATFLYIFISFLRMKMGFKYMFFVRISKNNYFVNNNPMNHKKYRRAVSSKKKEWWGNLSEEEKQKISENARLKTFEQIKKKGYINPSQRPGVKLKQKYAAYKRYNNIEGMAQIKKEAREQGVSLNHKVISIEYVGYRPIYDLEVEDTHNFAVNGIFIHNSGYPDCRKGTIAQIEYAIRKAMDFPFTIETPLINKTKADTVLMMEDMGKEHWYYFTHTCYNGRRPPCGDCPACRLREKGFKEAGLKDPLLMSEKEYQDVYNFKK